MITAFLGALLSIVITFLLLSGQTKSERDKDKDINIFKKKLSVYSSFNGALWKESDRINFGALRQLCMQQLVFFLDKHQINKIETQMKMLAEGIENDDSRKIKDARSAITAILKVDIDNANGKTKQQDEVPPQDIARLYITLNDDNISESPQTRQNQTLVLNNENEIKEEMDKEKETMFDPNKTYWHFSALEPDKQKKALERDEPFVSLIEYGENWRTERLKQVKNGDIIFLFNRGGAGYVGMYRAVRTEVLEISSNGDGSGKLVTNTNGKVSNENVSIENFVDKGRDIYEAIEDGADYVSNIFVEPIKVKNVGRPIGTIRPTILRIGEENTKILLDYFNKE